MERNSEGYALVYFGFFGSLGIVRNSGYPEPQIAYVHVTFVVPVLQPVCHEWPADMV
jgi:hypothetical protein